MEEILARIDEKKAQLDAVRPLSLTVVAKLKEYFDVEWTYHSNAIEGSTLTLAETRLVVLDGLTVSGKSLREHLEAINHKHAIDFVEALARRQKPITEHNIRQIHALILRTVDDENAGSYRNVQVRITGTTYVPPQAIAVPSLMQEMVDWLNSVEAMRLHPVERSALAHFRLAHIHPFVDGNGRTARLLMNLILMREGYPPAVIRMKRRPQYYEALALANGEERKPFITLVAEEAERSLDIWLEMAGDDRATRRRNHVQRSV